MLAKRKDLVSYIEWGKNFECYRRISEDILDSDAIAYNTLYGLLNMKGKLILDFGCFQGDSSFRILISTKPSLVVGVDIDYKSIKEAEKKYHKYKKLVFYSIGEGQAIPLAIHDNKFDVALMTFVHPTISKIKALEECFFSISQVLKKNGILALLSLNSKSFNKGYSFYNYNHRLPACGYFKDGKKFWNTLRKSNGDTISFFDFCWENSTLKKLLLSSGFSDVSYIDLKFPNSLRINSLLTKSFRKVYEERGIDFSNRDEFKAPLYQIILAMK
ncbi:methyltransferase domain-containing protein [Candidatus Dojkabacteria bacterium]|nr:methyltransferase domain-containing protein [Candidatus Dojkabacteria bacterium]